MLDESHFSSGNGNRQNTPTEGLVPIPPMEQPGEDISIVNRNRYGQQQQRRRRRPSLKQQQQVTDLANRMKDIFAMESSGGAHSSPSGASNPTVDGNLSSGINPEILHHTKEHHIPL